MTTNVDYRHFFLVKMFRRILGSPTIWEYREKISLRNIETCSVKT